MLSNWQLWLYILAAICIAVESNPVEVSEDTKKTEQTLKPKVKRAKEVLMYGNQQNYAGTEKSDADYNAAMDKRTLSNSGLEDIGSTFIEAEQQPPNNFEPLLPNGYIIDRSNIPLHEKNYEYGKILVNELGDIIPRGVWQLPSRGYYYGMSGEDRRKRSDDSNSSSSSVSSSTFSSSIPQTSNTVLPAVSPSVSKPINVQHKRNLGSYYQEPRYKRALDIDPEEYVALLSLYNNERRNPSNWRNFGNDEYDMVDDDSNVISVDDEDPRGALWLDSHSGYPQQRHYYTNDPLLSSELNALGRNKLNNYYDQFIGQQYGGSGNQQYETNIPYGTAQYGVPYIQRAYYTPEKRFMMNRKRAQSYESYKERLMNNPRSMYLNYKNRPYINKK